MKSTIYLPTKCKVGFNPRPDTYSGKLGYVIYHDGRTWRKETSWKNWIYTVNTSEEFKQKKLKEYNYWINNIVKNNIEYYKKFPQETPKYPITKEEAEKQHPYSSFTHHSLRNITSDVALTPYEFENVPTEGFVINKDAGGVKGSWSSWNPRLEKIRVYDPRGFEIEITIPNLLHILTNTNSIKGKGLEGKFLYGWDGTELVLISEFSPEYQEIQKFSELKNSKSISKKDLKVGEVYEFDDLTKKIYLGEYMVYDHYGMPTSKSFIFLNECYFKKNIVEGHFSNYTTTARVKKHSYSGEEYVAEFVEKMLTFSKFKPKEFTEELITKLPVETYGKVFFIEKNGKKVKTKIEKRSEYRYQGFGNRNYFDIFIIKTGNKQERFASQEELFKTHKIWQLKKVSTQQS
jgi:hypothetical protein